MSGQDGTTPGAPPEAAPRPGLAGGVALPLPPGGAERVSARSALVLAPHYDDEVLGCGGLVAQLAAAGAAVRVLFLSDSGGAGAVEDREAYAARRRAESAVALAALGPLAATHLALPDGALAAHLPALREAIGRELAAHAPELILVPSPLELTGDHRAAFAALFGVLSPLRRGDALHAALAAVQVLLYEVNHPAFPDLLVDVGPELPRLETAMAAYASQQERHDYLAAGIGLRRWRALSLPAGVAAAEAYRRLGLDDFTTRSLARLVRDVGGAPELPAVEEGPLVSVVVRTCERPRLLAQALASLAASTYRHVEVVLVVDGGGEAPVPEDFPFPVRRLDLQPRQGRARAANAGVEAARGAHVGFLDDDDLVEPEHLATLVGLVGAAGVRVAYTDAAVGVYELEAQGWRQVERRLPYSRDFDPELLLVDNYIPLHTLLVERALLREAGPFDAELPFFEDWDLLLRLARRAPFHHLAQVTCEYRHFRGGAHILGERPRERPDFLAMKERVLARHAERLTPAALARVVDRLRAEAVLATEEAAAGVAARAALERELHPLRGEAAGLRGEAAALRGEVVGLHGERDRLLADVARYAEAAAERHRELERLHATEEELRRRLAEQEAHLARCYAEIERLNRLLAAMRATRAWKMHEWLERRRA